MYKIYASLEYLFWIALILILPFITSSQTVEPELPIRYFYLSLVITFGGFLAYKLNIDLLSFGKSSNGQFLLLFVLWGLFNSYFALQKTEAWYEHSKMILFFILLSILYAFFQKDTSIVYQWSRILSIVILLLLGVGIWQWQYFEFKISATNHLYATLSNPNLYASGILICIPFPFILLFHSKSTLLKILIGSILLAAFVGLIMIKSKSAILSFGTGISTFIYIYAINKNNKRISKKYFIILFALLISGILFSVFTYLGFILKNNFWDVITSETAIPGLYDGNIERLFFLKKSLKMIWEHFVLGVGSGHWKLYYPKYGVQGWYLNTGWVQYLNPHNDFIWIWTEYGIIGFVLYLSFIYSTTKNFCTQLCENFGPSFLTSLLLFAGWIMFLTDSFFSFPKERPFHLVLFGIYTVLSTRPKERNSLKLNFNATVILLFICSIISYFYWERLNAEFFLKKAREARKSHKWEECVFFASKSEKLGLRYSSINIEPVALTKAMAYDELGNIDSAYANYIKAYALAPYYLFGMVQYAGVLHAQNNNKEALRIIQEMYKITPNFWFALRLHSLILLKQNKLNESIEILNKRTWSVDEEFRQIYNEIFRARLIIQYETLPENYPYLECIRKIIEENKTPLNVENQYNTEKGVKIWIDNHAKEYCGI